MATKEQKSNAKATAKLVMEIQGISYDDWLHEKHLEQVDASSGLIQKGLTKLKKDEKDKTHKSHVPSNQTTGDTMTKESQL
ncbi:hypothetical protein [Listeria booriae]|uniref:Uncharacterized protein n=1 Tax=Listeria booriae TaxID=1552123 RepID=A0A7X0ZQI7_9LIST|nr:hypothetical protein [Listeria booriae]MBC2080870.1 hypothetical protein [Listeria booriae]MBC2149730.1 hypothetical protein [Listeria booriae]MBC2305845.1 hypothetical protein [Listeria booriae]MBC2312050.1 hypothetical protein [Listeria booriae]MBC2324623.1 hypothetical protein [Listeria booriae]